MKKLLLAFMGRICYKDGKWLVKIHLLKGKYNLTLLRQRGTGVQLDENIKWLIKELSSAINESLSSSDAIRDAIKKIKGRGYDIFLVIEATIGIDKPTSGAKTSSRGKGDRKPIKLKINALDREFLKSLKISVEDGDVEET